MSEEQYLKLIDINFFDKEDVRYTDIMERKNNEINGILTNEEDTKKEIFVPISLLKEYDEIAKMIRTGKKVHKHNRLYKPIKKHIISEKWNDMELSLDELLDSIKERYQFEYLSNHISNTLNEFVSVDRFYNCGDDFDRYYYEEEYEIMDNKKQRYTIDIKINRCQLGEYPGGKDGYSIFVDFVNNSKVEVDIDIKELYLVQSDSKREKDYYYSGYVREEACILPKSANTAGRIWIADSLQNNKLNEDDYIVVLMENKTHHQQYTCKFALQNNCWINTYYNCIKNEKNAVDIIEEKLKRYKKLLTSGLINQNDYDLKKNELLMQL